MNDKSGSEWKSRGHFRWFRVGSGVWIACVFALWAAAAPPQGNDAAGAAVPTTEIMVNGHLFTLEIAATPARREHGLMQRREIPFDGGMLFVFPDDKPRTFWMCHTLVPLDLVFLDREGRVIALHTMMPEPAPGPGESEVAYRRRLPLYGSGAPCRYAIEFKAGTLGLLQLEVGDRVALDTAALQKLVRAEPDANAAPE